MKLAQRLKFLREQEGLSQTALADRAGVSQQLISQIENGVNRTTKDLPKLARALRVAVQALDPTYDVHAEPTPGLAEPDLAPWIGKNDVVHAATQGLRHPEIYRLNRDHLDMGVVADDILVVEAQHMATPGDLVIANLVDMESATARRLLRRYMPPYLIGGPEIATTAITTDEAAILGVVTAVLRLKPRT